MKGESNVMIAQPVFGVPILFIIMWIKLSNTSQQLLNYIRFDFGLKTGSSLLVKIQISGISITSSNDDSVSRNTHRDPFCASFKCPLDDNLSRELLALFGKCKINDGTMAKIQIFLDFSNVPPNHLRLF